MNWIGLPRRPRLKNLLFLPFSFVVAMILFAPLLMPLPAHAADGVAITGSFYAHLFQIPPGASVYGSDIYVSIRNTSDQNNVGFNVKTNALNMTDNSPVEGIDITLSPSPLGIVLAPGVSQQFQVAVEVGDIVTPNQYKMWITAEPYVATGGPIAVLPAVRMSADLQVVGESRQILVETVGRSSGEPIAVVIRLYRVVENRRYEVAYSDIGQLRTKVALGSYLAVAESQNGDFLAEQSFEATAGDEEMIISLPVETIYFEGFAVNPAYSTETGELGYAQIAYTINNVYQPIPVATVRLVVNFNGESLEGPRIIHTYEPLQVRREGQPYDYRPVDDWQKGTYGFSLQLYTGDQLYASTREVTLDVGGGARGSWLWIIFVILGVLGAAGLGFLIFFLLKRRRKGEKPARKVEGPAWKPEPVRPAVPVKKEEPTVEPAPLATVSTLKARMAALGRDEGTGEAAEEEAGVETRDEPERPAGKAIQEKKRKPSSAVKPAALRKPGIFSKVTATEKKEPLRPPTMEGPAPAKAESEVQINWPPKSVEPLKPAAVPEPAPAGPESEVQISWPPKPTSAAEAEVALQGAPEETAPAEETAAEESIESQSRPSRSIFAEAMRQRTVAQQQRVRAPEETAPAEEAGAEESGEPPSPPSKSSFAEAARLRMEARQQAAKADSTDAATGESHTEGDDGGESGEGENRSPSS